MKWLSNTLRALLPKKYITPQTPCAPESVTRIELHVKLGVSDLLYDLSHKHLQVDLDKPSDFLEEIKRTAGSASILTDDGMIAYFSRPENLRKSAKYILWKYKCERDYPNRPSQDDHSEEEIQDVEKRIKDELLMRWWWKIA